MDKDPRQNLETKKEIKKEQLTSFREEIQQIKDAETEKRAQGRDDYDPHFDINPEELGKREYEAFTLYKNGALTINLFHKLRQERPEPSNESIKIFWAYLGNRMQDIALEELRAEEQQKNRGVEN